MKILIRNGHLLCPQTNLDEIADIAIENGKIISIQKKIDDFSAHTTIDAKAHLVLPGLIDVCHRPQIGGLLHKEAHSALLRGITGLCIPPDGESVTDTPFSVAQLCAQAEHSTAQLYPIGALTLQLQGQNLADLTTLKKAGCVAFTQAQNPIQNLNKLRHYYDYAASFDLLIIIQPQDPWLSQGGVAHEGMISTYLGLPGIPDTAESIAIAQHLALIEHTKVRAHFTCLSSKKGVQLIREAKARHLPITADVAMHSLFLTEQDIGAFNSCCHVAPPLRSETDKLALLAGIRDGTIDMICSDHRPLDSRAKLAPFAESTKGMSTMDTYLSLGLRLVEDTALSMLQLVELLSTTPARVFQLPGGNLKIGEKADLCIVSPKAKWDVTNTTLYSGGKNSPFLQHTMSGVVTHTLLAGKMVHAP